MAHIKRNSHSRYGLHVVAIVFLVASNCGAAPANVNSKNQLAVKQALFQGPHVFLTVSSLAGWRIGELLDRMLEMHWQNFETLPGDIVALYDENPADIPGSDLISSALEHFPAETSTGRHKTQIRYERRTLNPSMERCLFWVAYLRTENGVTTIFKSNCLSVHPTWMDDLKNEIKNIPLHSLMIPGTHNAGAWHYYDGLPSEGVVIQYTYCHEDSIYEQLIHGIRSLDVRVGYYPNTDEKFYTNHDAVRIRPLHHLIDDVKRFVSETNEIVFLDFHRFPVGFTGPEIHHEFVTFLQEQFGDLIAPKSLTLSVTPQQLWDLNKRVVLFYIEDDIQREYDILWPGVQQAWGDTNELANLETYFNSAIPENGCKQKAWSAMAQLTSTAQDVILRPTFGVRGFSNLSNIAVTEWYQRESWYSKSMIVALDFYLGTNLIEMSLEVNKNHANVCV